MTGEPRRDQRAGGAPEACDAVVVGAGFAGIYMVHKLRELGLIVRAFEAGDDFGGTWYWNRYPGARCDIESLEYQFSFSDDLVAGWHWSERYARDDEIRRYFDYVATRLDVRGHFRFGTRVLSAYFDDVDRLWTVTTDQGHRVCARYCIMATGCLSEPNLPPIEGLDTFAGEHHQTSRWPHVEVDFSGKRVGVIGTGSTGIQCIPEIAERAAHLTVFQRSPNFSVPARHGRIEDARQQDRKQRSAEIRDLMRRSPRGAIASIPSDRLASEFSDEELLEEFERAWAEGGPAMGGVTRDMRSNAEVNEKVQDFIRAKIRSIVKDPQVAEMLCPYDHYYATKRPCMDDRYYETFNRPNTTLIDVRSDPIRRIMPDGIETERTRTTLDMIVFATGFDAMTGALLRMDIRGRAGTSLRDRWAHGPQSYLGVMISGFPNLFTITGPGSPSVLSNVVISIEQHVEWVADCIAFLKRENIPSIEPTPEAEARWVDHVTDVTQGTLLTTANSWYVGANIAGKPRVFMPYAGGVGRFREICDGIAARGYEGFSLQRSDRLEARSA